MMLFQRSIVLIIGKDIPGMEFARNVVKLVKDKFDVKVKVYTQWLGDRPMGTLFFVAKFENLAKFEEFMMKLGTDEDYLSLFRGSQEDNIFVSGTQMDNVMVEQI